MNILIAEERKNLLSALKLLLETEIEQIDYIREVSERMDLDKAVEEEKPDILIMDGEFLNHNTKDAIISFKKSYPDMSLVIIDFDHGKEKQYLKLNIDLFITKGNPSTRILNSLINFVKKKASR